MKLYKAAEAMRLQSFDRRWRVGTIRVGTRYLWHAKLLCIFHGTIRCVTSIHIRLIGGEGLSTPVLPHVSVKAQPPRPCIYLKKRYICSLNCSIWLKLLMTWWVEIRTVAVNTKCLLFFIMIFLLVYNFDQKMFVNILDFPRNIK